MPIREYLPLRDKEWLRQQVRNNGVREIAAELGCNHKTVHRAVQRHGINMRAEQSSAKVERLVGKRFGALVVREAAKPRPRSGNLTVRADCDCGGSKVITIWALENRGPGWDHCGCQNEARWRQSGDAIRIHGQRRPVASATYRSWQAMRDRCYRPSTNGYRSFGGRGIQVCDRWRTNFAAFLEDMGERPDGMTLDRIDVDGHYEPGNCRWATAKEQQANKRKAAWLSRRQWSLIRELIIQDGSTEALGILAELDRVGAVKAE